MNFTLILQISALLNHIFRHCHYCCVVSLHMGCHKTGQWWPPHQQPRNYGIGELKGAALGWAMTRMITSGIGGWAGGVG